MTRIDGVLSTWLELIDRLPVPAYALDIKGTVVVWNMPLSRLSGINGAEVIGRAGGAHAVPFIGTAGAMIADLVLDPSRPTPDHLTGLEGNGDRRTARLSAHALKAGRRVTVMAAPVTVGGERVGVVEIVIDPESLDPRIGESREIIDLLLSTVRHDILNDLTIVLGYIELARDAIPDPAANADLNRAVAAADAIRGRIEFTREFQRIGSRSPVDRILAVLVRDAADRVDLDGIRLECAIPELLVRADPLLPRVLEHLLRLSSSSAPRPTAIRIEATGTDPLVLRYGDDGGGGCWMPQADGSPPRELGPMLLLMRDVLALDEIELLFRDDLRWPIELRIPGSLLRPVKKEG